MKPFNIVAAAAGAPICTKYGCIPARIIHWNPSGEYPILALIDTIPNKTLCYYNELGHAHPLDGDPCNYDLVMEDTIVEGWVNIYRCDPSTNPKMHCQRTISKPYQTEELAKSHKNECPHEYITTTKIKWEE